MHDALAKKLLWMAAAAALSAGCRRDSEAHPSPTQVRVALATPSPAPPAVEPAPPPRTTPLTLDERLEAGFHVFARTCVTCHQPSGRGMPNAFPPLAGSDFLMADKARSIRIVLGGLGGPITVNESPYSASMPSHAQLSDDEIADVLSFVRSTWGNRGEPVTRDEVAAQRARGTPPVTVAANQ